MHRSGRPWRDEGLVPNTERFVEALARALSCPPNEKALSD
jgi:hypothetical protein